MSRATPEVDDYLATGCGRCDRWNTPSCRVIQRRPALSRLRELLLESELSETRKWGQPVYTLNATNVVLLFAFGEECGLSFFKGALMEDPEGLLMQRTPNIQAARELRFGSLEAIEASAATVRACLAEAIAVERSGREVELKTTDDFEVPEELRAKFAADPAFEAAFQSLTPGRQRGYLLHFAGAKQSTTRARRIEKHAARIFAGLGMHDR